MAKRTFSNMFSWKHGFLENKQQCISNRNGYRNDLSKRPKKVASPDATINPDSYQWKITTSTAVAMTAAANSKATNPAILPDSTGSEATFHTTHVCEIPENTSTPPSSPMSNGPISYMTKGFDKRPSSLCFAHLQSSAQGEYPHLQHWESEACQAYQTSQQHGCNNTADCELPQQPVPPKQSDGNGQRRKHLDRIYLQPTSYATQPLE